ncbi:MAG: hypothetical protein CFH06_01091, partial [Alphaproteobacteria bacterium MarineAlpha3_Bin5]
MDSNIIQETMRLGGKNVIGERGTIEVFNPYNNKVTGIVPKASKAQVAKAFKIANDFKPNLTRYERQQILHKTANAIAGRKDEIANLITAESGLSKKDSLYETGRSFDVFTLAGQLCI